VPASHYITMPPWYGMSPFVLPSNDKTKARTFVNAAVMCTREALTDLDPKLFLFPLFSSKLQNTKWCTPFSLRTMEL
jgi:hypothetical protein